MNAKVENGRDDYVVGPIRVGVSNENSCILVDFCK